MDEEDVVHMYNGILVTHKKEWNDAICNNMDTTGDYHTKWNKKNTNIIYHLHMASKIRQKWTHPQNRNRLTD